MALWVTQWIFVRTHCQTLRTRPPCTQSLLQASVRDTAVAVYAMSDVADKAAVYAMSDIGYTAAVYAITATGKR